MIKSIKHLFLLIAFFCVGMVQAQTTDLIYHLGSSGSTVNVASVATDASGNIFICGDYTGANVDFNPLGAPTLKSSAGTSSGFIAAYDANGALKKVISFGSTLVNKGLKVYIDPADKNIYLLAAATGLVNFITGSGFAGSVQAGSGAMALVKYDKALTYKTAKIFYDGTGYAGDVLNDLAFYGADLYVTGTLFSANVEFNPGGNSKKLSALPVGFSEIFVAKYDTTTLTLANDTWAFSFGATKSDGGNGIDIDNAGNIYLTGYFTGQNTDIDPGGSISVSEAGEGTAVNGDAFVAKYNSSMKCQWAFNIGAVQSDQGNDILVDKSTGNVYVGGIVNDDALPIYFDPTTTASASFPGYGLYDFFVASYTSAGAYNWHLATGSAGQDRLTSLAFDSGGNIVLSGYVSGNVNFGNSKNITGLGGNDAYFAVISATTGLATAAYNLGGTSDEQANSVTVDPTGKYLVVGSYKGTGDYNLGAAVPLTISGTQDGFITRHVLCSPPSITTQPSSTIKCEGTAASFTVVASGATSYQWKKGTTIISGATTATYSIPAVAIAQAGNYTVEITNACQTATSSSVTLTVNPKPSITSLATYPVCSGSSVGYTITSDIAATYSWTRAFKSGISPSTGTGTSNPIAEVLTNAGITPIDADYIITPTATTGSCIGSPFTLTVSVYAKPTITSAASGTVCSGVAQSYLITSNIASIYTWSRALVSGISNGAVSNQMTNQITETLINTTVNPVNVVYIISPLSTVGALGCIGNSFNYTVTVNPSVTPTITATSSATTICSGTNIILTANSTNAGTPTYKWKLGSGYISGATSSTYATSGATNGNVYSVEMTSTAACASPATVTSTGVTITVTPSVTPTITATSSATTICTGTNITLTASATNAGTPTYKWKLGSNYISGATSSTYATLGATNGDVYSVEMTSTAACASPAIVTSTGVTITVTAPVAAAVTATSSATTICPSTSITLTASPVNGGVPTYKWKLGTGYISGATNSTYTTTGAANNDSYTVEMTSSLSCATPATVTSTPVVIIVNPTLVPTVTISTVSNTICAGDVITFASVATNPGTTPSYVWRKNGVAITPAATGTSYSTTGAANGDVYSVAMTSNALCVSPTSDISNTIAVTVNPLPTITGTTTVCTGSTITLIGSGTANASNPWVSSSPAIATVSNAGVVTGVAAGTTDITYKNNNGCLETVTVTVNTTPAISGILSVCDNLTTQLTGSGTAATSNAWISALPTVATVSSTGLVTAITPGTSVITYKNNTGCSTTATVTVNALPTITGTPTVCDNLTTQLTGSGTPASSNAWVSGTPAIATVSNTGLVTGVSGGTSVITYKNSNGCTTTQIVTVNPIAVPAVSITANNSTICAGGSITFTAVPTNGGTPTYKWKLGSGYIASATNATYTTTTAVNGNSYSVEMTSNAICTSISTVTSNAIAITVTTSVTPTVTISANPGNTICAGAPVTFTATPGNGGTAPTYKWKLNGTIIPTATNVTYTTSALVNGDQISVDMVSNSTCASTFNASSLSITMVVNPVVAPAVTIATPSLTVCAGTGVVFTAANVNGGAAPLFEWFVNSVSQGSPSSSTTYTSSILPSGAQVLVKMTSNAICATASIVSSNNITITVTPNVTPSVSITSNKSTICAGGSVVYTATPLNGGTASYQWKVNGTNFGIAIPANTFTTSSLTDGDVVTVVLTSSVACVTSSTATSNGLTITVAPETQITSQPSNQSVCALGNNVTFSVGATGDNLTYQWKTGTTNLSNNTTYSGVTTKDLSISNVSSADLLGYKVTVTGTCGIALTSNVATLIQATSLITITAQPVAQILEVGEMIQLSVSATGPTLSYQWKKNGVDLVNDSRISGANTASLQISNALVTDSDNNYTCLIKSPCATQVSTNATSVTVTTATSTQNALTKGFVVAPNPSAGHFTLSNNYSPFVVEEIEIISMEGIVVARKTIAGTTSLNEEIFAQDLPKGMYVLVIKGEGEQALLKVVFDK